MPWFSPLKIQPIIAADEILSIFGGIFDFLGSFLFFKGDFYIFYRKKRLGNFCIFFVGGLFVFLGVLFLRNDFNIIHRILDINSVLFLHVAPRGLHGAHVT